MSRRFAPPSTRPLAHTFVCSVALEAAVLDPTRDREAMLRRLLALMRLVDTGVPLQWRETYRTREGEPQILELRLEVEAVPFQRELGRRS